MDLGRDLDSVVVWPWPLTQFTQQIYLWLRANFSGAMSVPKVMKIELGFQCLLWHIPCLLPSPSAPEVEAVSTEGSPFTYDFLSDPVFKVKHMRAGKDSLFHFPSAVTLYPQGSKMYTLQNVCIKEILLWHIALHWFSWGRTAVCSKCQGIAYRLWL